MAKYYPKNKIITGLYTQGKEYMTLQGEEYVGSYFKTSDGKKYTGPRPTPRQVELIKYEDSSKTLIKTSESNVYDSLPKNTDVRDSNYPNVFKPTPTEDQYQAQFIKRYFIVKRNDNSVIMEVSQKEYTRVLQGRLKGFYKGISLDWKIAGAKEDRINTNGLEELGVVNTNYRMLTLMEDDLPGISRRLQNLLDLSIYPGFVSYNSVHNSLQ